jgi:hypothetical protein
VAETTVKRFLCCEFLRTAKAMGQLYQCWRRIYREENVPPLQVPVSHVLRFISIWDLFTYSSSRLLLLARADTELRPNGQQVAPGKRFLNEMWRIGMTNVYHLGLRVPKEGCGGRRGWEATRTLKTPFLLVITPSTLCWKCLKWGLFNLYVFPPSSSGLQKLTN